MNHHIICDNKQIGSVNHASMAALLCNLDNILQGCAQRHLGPGKFEIQTDMSVPGYKFVADKNGRRIFLRA